MVKITTMGDIFAEEEDRLIEKGRAEIAKEKAAFDALPQEEKDRITLAREIAMGFRDADGNIITHAPDDDDPFDTEDGDYDGEDEDEDEE